MKELKYIYYLGTRVNYQVSLDNFVKVFEDLITKGNSVIYTLNPEFIVDSYFDSNFQRVLNYSDLNVIDGVGLKYGIKKNFKVILPKKELKEIKTLPGADLVDEVLKIAEKKHYSVFILGGSRDQNVSERAISKIIKKYPKIKIIGGSSEFSFEEKDDEVSIEFIKEKLRENSLKEVDILLVGYGHKRQEFWIRRNASKIPARVSIGVGGTLDFISGNIKRAPRWVRNLGFEWFYRLVKQPSRFFRIIKATLIFSYLSFMSSFNNSSLK